MSEPVPLLEVILQARRVVNMISADSESALSFPIDIIRQIYPVVRKLMEEKTRGQYSINFRQIEGVVDSVRGKLLRYEEPYYAAP